MVLRKISLIQEDPGIQFPLPRTVECAVNMESTTTLRFYF